MQRLPASVVRRVEQGHKAHEDSHGVICGYTPFSLVARADGPDPIGVLSGYTAYMEIHVDDLWVDARHRGRGIGRALLTSLEESYANAGFVNITLVTNAFQAISFYQKCGFEIEFTRRNPVEPKLSKTFFVKWLDR